MGGTKESLGHSNSAVQSQSLRIILHGSQLYHLGSRFRPLNHTSFFMIGSMYLQMNNFLSMLNASRNLGCPEAFHFVPYLSVLAAVFLLI